jgi:hypothetical protein
MKVKEPREAIADKLVDLIGEDKITLDMIESDIRKYFSKEEFPSIDELKEALIWAWSMPCTYWMIKYEDEPG